MTSAFRVFSILAMHGGNRKLISQQFGVDPESLTDFSTGINPLGYPPVLRQLVNRNLSRVNEYPDPSYEDFRNSLSRITGYSSEQIVQGNGSSELLPALLRSLSPAEVLLPVPCYIDYEDYCHKQKIPVRHLYLSKDNGFLIEADGLESAFRDAADNTLVILGNPGNPTGRLLPSGLVENLARAFPKIFFCVDEAYLAFAEDSSRGIEDGPNIIRIRSLTKLFAVPGIRVAYLTAEATLADRIRGELPTWNLGTLATETAPRFLEEQEFIKDSRTFINREKRILTDAIAKFASITVFPGDAPFLLIRLDYGDPDTFHQALIHRGILLRHCNDYENLDDRFFRIGVRTAEENQCLLNTLDEVLNKQSGKSWTPRKKRTPAIMFQGTSSNAGKSLMTAAMCRVLADEGIRVAPFKAQNMSLNSFVTSDGGEMGRAQVLQAMAARIEPTVLMNPVLLKPTGDQGSQVIVNGQPWDSLQARQYYQQKTELRKAVHQAYDELCSDVDAVVLEGAGSPGEVNLKKHDIVNMPMARYAESPVILVGDIDRGGVYASFIGHMAVMDEWERNLTAGFLVNKFRGDATLLEDAHDYVRDYTGKEILGVMPWVRDHRLPEEDGVDFEERYGQSTDPAHPEETTGGQTIIGVVELPHISNSTDLDPFLNDSGVRLVRINSLDRYRETGVHSIIIPGTRNVIGDYRHLQRLGIIEAIKSDAVSGKISVFGICGGFQMLGRSIYDPLGLEVAAGTRIQGMGLLDMETVLEESKVLSQRETQFQDDESKIIGYEIHHGKTSYKEMELFAAPGLGCRKDLVWGTYLHGIFENDGIRNAYLRQLGYFESPISGTFKKTVDEALNEFTDIFRRSVNIDEMKRLMGL